MQSRVVLTVLKDCEVTMDTGRRWNALGHPIPTPLYRLPPPPEEGYRQALEVCKVLESKQAEEVGGFDTGEGEQVVERRENDGNDGQRVRLGLDGEGVPLKEYIKMLPSYKEVIKKIVRNAATMCMFGMGMSLREKGVSEQMLLKVTLATFLDACLEMPLQHQGMRIVVGDVLKLKPEDTKGAFRVTIFAMSLGTERKPVWGLTIETKTVLVENTLEKAAAVVVAKALSLRGEMGLEQLDIAGKQKSIVREFLDKEKKEEVVEVEMVGLKEMFEGEEGGGDGVGQVDGEV